MGKLKEMFEAKNLYWSCAGITTSFGFLWIGNKIGWITPETDSTFFTKILMMTIIFFIITIIAGIKSSNSTQAKSPEDFVS